jgi:hypothetical protein
MLFMEIWDAFFWESYKTHEYTALADCKVIEC